MPELTRCGWAKDEFDILYHDTEWGFVQHNDNKLFEMLILEGMQAGLSWNIILRKRENMRRAFDGFDPLKIAVYDEAKKAALLQDAGIIRNRRKIDALVTNAKFFLEIQGKYGSFDAYIWNFVDGQPINNRLQAVENMPSENKISAVMSKDLKKQGFKFVGSTICYSYMQACGMVNDHIVSCAFHEKACRSFC